MTIQPTADSVFSSQLLLGQYNNIVRPVTIIGKNTTLTTLNDVWPGGGSISGNHTILGAGITLGISSDAAADAAAGTGARTVVVVGVLATGQEATVTLTLNGTSKVTDASGLSFIAVNFAYVATWGTGLTNAGRIYIYDSTDTVAGTTPGENVTITKRLAIIGIGDNYTRCAWYTVPNVGSDVCDLLIYNVVLQNNNATSTITYLDATMLANFLRGWHSDQSVAIGAKGAANWFPFDLGSAPSNSIPDSLIPGALLDPIVVLNGGVVDVQATASAATGIDVYIYGALAARNPLVQPQV